MLTDKELQSLRNLGNEAEAAADEITLLRRLLGEYAEALQCAGQPIEWQRKIEAAVADECERCADLVQRGRVAINWNERECLAKFIRDGRRVVSSDGRVA
jgi:hypothetical protein